MDHNPLVTNPAELALPFVEAIDTRSGLSIGKEEEELLVKLDHLTEVANMHAVYFTQAGRALSIPVSFESDQPTSYTSFNSLTFEGRLVTYSVVKIGRLIGSTSIRALCLSFDEVTLLPFFDTLPEDRLLHVPALAIDSMSRTAA
jgi:hypothetical protein